MSAVRDASPTGRTGMTSERGNSSCHREAPSLANLLSAKQLAAVRCQRDPNGVYPELWSGPWGLWGALGGYWHRWLADSRCRHGAISPCCIDLVTAALPSYCHPAKTGPRPSRSGGIPPDRRILISPPLFHLNHTLMLNALNTDHALILIRLVW